MFQWTGHSRSAITSLMLPAQRCVLCRQEFSSSVCQALARVTQASTANLFYNGRRNGPVIVLQTSYQMMPFLLLNKLIFLVPLFRVALACSTVSAFWNLIIITRLQIIKSSLNYCINFITAPSSCKQLIHGMSNVILIVVAKFCYDLTLLSIDNQHFFLCIMLLFLFLQLVVKWIDQVIFYLIYILNLIPVLIFTLYFI